VKRCASCGRDIPESLTVCDLCQRWASDHIAVAPVSHAQAAAPVSPLQTMPPVPAAIPRLSPSLTAAPAPAPSAKVAIPTSLSRLSRRDLTIMVAALAGGGIITVGVLAMRGGPGTATVAAANATSAPRRSAPAASTTPATQVWSTARSGYWTANQHHSAAFELPAENTVAIWLNYVRPLLVVRCMAKRTEAFVFTGSALKIEPETEDHTVSIRFDDEAAETTRWPDSAEHDALFSPDGAAFAQRILSARTLRFGYTPHNAAPVEAQFQVTGLADRIAPMAKDCGWQK
jgi:hypothetical protein